MRLIDADLLHFKLTNWTMDPWNKSIMPYGISDEIIDMVDDAPTIETIHGYNIEHLSFIAKVMEKEGVTAEMVVQTLKDVGRVAEMVLKEEKKYIEEFLKTYAD